MISQLPIQRLAQIRQPKNRGVPRVEPQVVENNLLARINARLLGADPIIRILHVMRGDAGVPANINLLVTFLLDSEFTRFQQYRIERNPQVAGVEEFPLIEIHCPVASLHHVSLIDADISLKRDGCRLAVPQQAVRKKLQPVVADNLHAGSRIPYAHLHAATDRAATEILDF